MKNNIYTMAKRGISITLSEKILKKLDSFCEENSANRSKFIEKLLKGFFKKKAKK